jgi:hypothetical protein
MSGRVGAFFSRLGTENPRKSSNEPEIDEAVVGKTLSLDLFKRELADLGYDFEVFTDRESKIYRFRRFVPSNDRTDGDVW